MVCLNLLLGSHGGAWRRVVNFFFFFFFAVFVLVVGHNILLSRMILNFPRNVKVLIGNNDGFKNNVKWAFDLIKKHSLTNNEEIVSLIDMVCVQYSKKIYKLEDQ